VLGISRLPGGSASSSSGGASTGVAGLEARQSAGGGSGASLGAVRTAAPAPSRVVPGRTGSQSLQGSAAGALRQAPLPLRAAYEARARLAAPLPKAFELLSTGHVRGGR
jgi:hypothetical protein